MKALIFVLMLFLNNTRLHAMGENQPGPNGGMIQMPGSFHSEVVLDKNQLKIYLLDIGMKNPTVNKSTVSVEYSTKEQAQLNKIHCRPTKNYFLCPLDKEKIKSLKSIQVESTRNGAKGKKVTYSFI